ncbi:MAG: hypothetical protein LC797_22785 [Chloroflexi bacterium]|nr:hypothetical protein [Chloroflexota bacterium]
MTSSSTVTNGRPRRLRQAVRVRALAMLAMGLVLVGAVPVNAAGSTSNTGVWTSTPSASDATRLTDLHSGWSRVTVPWNAIQSANATTYDWAALDAGMVNASSGGSRNVLALVRENPTWAAASRCKLSSDPERANLATFMTTLVNRYKGILPDGAHVGQTSRVKYWQLYNEAENTSEAFDTANDLGGCFGTINGTVPTDPGRSSYAQMLETVGQAIHNADSTASVVGAGLVSAQASYGRRRQLHRYRRCEYQLGHGSIQHRPAQLYCQSVRPVGIGQPPGIHLVLDAGLHQRAWSR